METVIKIIQSIQSESGKIAKQTIIKENLSNELFVKIMKFLLNDFIVTGLSKKKISKIIDRYAPHTEIYRLEHALFYLTKNNTGKDSDILAIQSFMSLCPKETQLFLTELLTKTLKIGVSADTWNKLVSIEHKLPVFDVMLAEKYFDNEHKVTDKFIITSKLDGNRAVCINSEDGLTIRTRQGQLYEGLIDIESAFEKLPKGFVYDGELIATNEEGLDSANLYRKTTSIVRKDGIKQNIIFHVFDLIPIEEFENGKSKSPCVRRKLELKNILNECDSEWIVEVQVLYYGSDKSQITYWLNDQISKGLEGVMVNIADAPYVCKRTSNILKVKKMQTVDLEIIGFEEGDGRLSNTLGRINVDYKGNVVGVGSGFSDDDRKFIWENKDTLLGRIVEIQYFEESSNKNDNSLSLRFPVFKCIREIGKDVSYY